MLKNNFPRQFGGTHEIGEKFEFPKLLGQSFFVGLKVLLLCRVVLSLILIFCGVCHCLFILMSRRARVDLIEPNMLLGHQHNWQHGQLAWEVNYGLM